MNPLISMMNQNPLLAMIQPLYSAMQTAKDPLSALSQMAMQDQRMQQVVQTINQNGGIQGAVYAEAQRRNTTPENALAQARQMIQTINMK